MHARTAWQALAHHPLAFLATLWPWRALAYLLSGVGVGALTLVVLVAGLLTGLVLLPLGVGAVVLLGVVLGGGVVARVERWRLRLVDLDPAATDRRAPDAPGVRAWLRTRLRDRLTWRELGFTAVSMTALWWMDLLVLAFALALPVLCVTAPLDDPGAWPWVVIGLALLAGGAVHRHRLGRGAGGADPAGAGAEGRRADRGPCLAGPAGRGLRRRTAPDRAGSARRGAAAAGVGQRDAGAGPSRRRARLGARP